MHVQKWHFRCRRDRKLSYQCSILSFIKFKSFPFWLMRSWMALHWANSTSRWCSSFCTFCCSTFVIYKLICIKRRHKVQSSSQQNQFNPDLLAMRRENFNLLKTGPNTVRHCMILTLWLKPHIINIALTITSSPTRKPLNLNNIGRYRTLCAS